MTEYNIKQTPIENPQADSQINGDVEGRSDRQSGGRCRQTAQNKLGETGDKALDSRQALVGNDRYTKRLSCCWGVYVWLCVTPLL